MAFRLDLRSKKCSRQNNPLITQVIVMNAILIGADRLGNIPELLSDWNINITRHITGRHVSHQRKQHELPRNTELLILFTDFLGHNVMRHYRDVAQVQGIRFIACRRSTSYLAQSLECCFSKKNERSQRSNYSLHS
ncbi:DUF2325 domain-containing protein [Candidatus Nitrotoga sp. HW29]|uniref:DUF2325 domain-containing protein n=1 Tax=Candidatus Nitrotoga sp. HW29 TaxID=2886963 RepID=UPI001EF3CECF|nr:DUF2325 domain-containing protein [Candidatus Nitrotoga sp. HW29]